MKSIASGLFLFVLGVAVVACAMTPTQATPIFNGGYACFNGNDRVHPNCSATPTPPPAGQVTYNGCHVFPANDPTWNTNVSSVAADPGNSGYMTAMLTAGTGWVINVSHSSTYWIINQANSGTQTYPLVKNDLATIEYTITAFPFNNSTFSWQGKGIQSDHHLMVVNNNGCTLSEAYSSQNESTSGVSWKATTAPAPVNGTTSVLEDVSNRNTADQFNLNSPYPTPMPTGNGQGSKYGGNPQLGGPVFPGLVRWEDYINNSPHALGIDGPVGFTLNGKWVYPAHINCGVCGTAAGLPPIGARVVMLPAATASVSCYNATPSLSTCPVASFIINCLLQYGAYLMDQTTATNTGFTLRLGNASNGSDPWANTSYNGDNIPTDLANLQSIAVNSTNFKFIPPPFSSTSIANCLNLYSPNGC